MELTLKKSCKELQASLEHFKIVIKIRLNRLTPSLELNSKESLSLGRKIILEYVLKK